MHCMCYADLLHVCEEVNNVMVCVVLSESNTTCKNKACFGKLDNLQSALSMLGLTLDLCYLRVQQCEVVGTSSICCSQVA